MKKDKIKAIEDKMTNRGKILNKIPIWVLIAFSLFFTSFNGVLDTKFQLMVSSFTNGFNRKTFVDLFVIKILMLIMIFCASCVTKTLTTKIKNKKILQYTQKILNSSVTEINKTSTGKIFDSVKDISVFSSDIVRYMIWITPTIIPLINMLYRVGKESIVGMISILTCIVVVTFMISFSDRIFKFDTIAKKYKANLSGTVADIFMNIKTAKYIHKNKYCIERLNKTQNETFPYFINIGKHAWTSLACFIRDLPYFITIIIFRDDIEMMVYCIMSNYLITQAVDYLVSIIDTCVEMRAQIDVIKNLNGSDNKIKYNNMPDMYEMKNIDFNYGDHTAQFHIDNITFVKGKRYHMTGSSGSGKSSLANLIVGSIPTSNKMMKLNTFYVYQETEMFNDTLRNNLTFYNNKISDKELISLINEIKLDKMLSRMKDGLDTIIGERGCKISSGEKQRINIIRTIIRMRERNDEFIILDEITSNLDAESEKKAIDMIDKECKNTLLLISHHGDFDKICDAHILVKNKKFYQSEYVNNKS